ncbi:MAG: glycosyltransferase family 2 protein [Pseudoxanthomonas sp.]
MPSPLPLSGVVIAKNEADRIGRCLASMRGVCAEMLVLDSGSGDDTVAVARAAGARVEHQDWLGYATQKNAAIARATQPWLLLLDADEWLADGAEAALRELFAGGRIEQADAWRLPRTNWFLGTRLRRIERFERLVRPDHRFLPMRIHERPDLAGKRVRDCDAAIGHSTARSLPQHRDKLKRYARLWAEQKFEEGRRCSALAPWTHAAAYWLKAYLLDGAWREGRGGWRFHACHARAVVDKYRGLHALGRSARR